MSDNTSPYLLTLPQLLSAKKKIGIVASSYDPKEQAFRGFDSAYVTPVQFRQQLRRNFLIELTDAELGALVFLFNNGDGKVDSVMFINEFYKLGKQEKEKFWNEHLHMRKKIEETERVRLEAYAMRLSKLAIVPVSSTWTKAEEQSAIKKIAMIAFSYDKQKGGFSAFQNAPALSPAEFRMIIRLNFQVNLSPQETGALVKLFDTDGNGLIDSKEFMYAFFMIGSDEKERHLQEHLRIMKKHQDEEAERIRVQKEVYAKRVSAKIVPHSSKDMDSFRRKIKDVALCFDSGSMFNNLSKAFESDGLNPTQFKELLKFNLGIVLTPGELDAALKVFDKDGNGSISCTEFTSMFFKLQIEEKSHLFLVKKDQNVRIHYEEEKRRRAKKLAILDRTRTSVLYPCLPVDEFAVDSDDDEVMVGGGSGSAINNSSFITTNKSDDTLNNSSNNPFLVDDSNFVAAEGSNITFNSTGGMRASTTPYRSRNRKSRKAPLSECLSPSKFAAPKLSKSTTGDENGDNSFAAFFPKASQETKSFLTELEEKEAEMARSERERRKEIAKNSILPSEFSQSIISLPKMKKSSLSLDGSSSSASVFSNNSPSASAAHLRDNNNNNSNSNKGGNSPVNNSNINSNNSNSNNNNFEKIERPSTSHASSSVDQRPNAPSKGSSRNNSHLDATLKDAYKDSHHHTHHVPLHNESERQP